MKSKIQYCNKTNKFCYSSEAKAVKAINKYDDIKRVYYCEDCDNWHSTSIEGVKTPEKGVSKEAVARELERLLKLEEK